MWTGRERDRWLEGKRMQVDETCHRVLLLEAIGIEEGWSAQSQGSERFGVRCYKPESAA